MATRPWPKRTQDFMTHVRVLDASPTKRREQKRKCLIYVVLSGSHHCPPPPLGYSLSRCPSHARPLHVLSPLDPVAPFYFPLVRRVESRDLSPPLPCATCGKTGADGVQQHHPATSVATHSPQKSSSTGAASCTNPFSSLATSRSSPTSMRDGDNASAASMQRPHRPIC